MLMQVHWQRAAIALAAGGAPSDAVVGVAIGGNDRPPINAAIISLR